MLLIFVFSVLGGVFSLVGGLALLAKKNWPDQLLPLMISFGAGVMLATSFFDLLPEAIEVAADNGIELMSVLQLMLIGIATFFIYERSFVWFHHHHGPHKHQPNPVIPMVWLSDTIHNFLDGLVITASFLVSAPLGIATAFAVAVHELPQEISDFSLYLAKGVSRRNTLLLNIFSSFATVIAATLAFYFRDAVAPWQYKLLAFSAGMFTYIACSDLIPELHRTYQKKLALVQSFLFLAGIIVMYVFTRIFGV